MRTLAFTIILIVPSGFIANTYAQAPTPVGPVPNARQIEWYHREIMAFFYYDNYYYAVDGPGSCKYEFNIHEYLHSIVNPIVEANYPKSKDKIEKYFNAGETGVYMSNYQDPLIFACECMVRALDDRIRMNMENDAEAKKKRENWTIQQTGNGFTLTYPFYLLLAEFEKTEKRFGEFVPTIKEMDPARLNKSFNFSSSNLPIIVIITENGRTIPDEPKIKTHMGIIYNGEGVRNNPTDPFSHCSGPIGIEFRGNVTQSFPKKSYLFETRDASGNNLNVSLQGTSTKYLRTVRISEKEGALFTPKRKTFGRSKPSIFETTMTTFGESCPEALMPIRSTAILLGLMSILLSTKSFIQNGSFR